MTECNIWQAIQAIYPHSYNIGDKEKEKMDKLQRYY